MLSLLVASTLALAGSLRCELQEGAEWAGSDGVTAVVCEDQAGFFVPSLAFRSLYVESEPYKLLEKQLQLAVRENAELRAVVRVSEKAIAFERRVSSTSTERWKQAEGDLLQAESDAERKWWESPPLWFSLGAAVASLLIASR